MPAFRKDIKAGRASAVNMSPSRLSPSKNIPRRRIEPDDDDVIDDIHSPRSPTFNESTAVEENKTEVKTILDPIKFSRNIVGLPKKAKTGD